MSKQRQQVFSWGGGVNTVAIAVMIAEEKLSRPDYIVMADTGREATSTWEYLKNYAQPYLGEIGLRVEIAPHNLATVDLYGHNGDLLLPMFTATGKLPTFCSSEWKEYVIRRWLRLKGVDQCDLWLGYSLDEIERVKPARVKWTQRVYPLLDLYLTRRDCLDIIARAGLPEPAKSACWMCPHLNNEELLFIRNNYPDDWNNRIRLEKQLREHDADVWLHQDRVLTENVDLSIDAKPQYEQCGLGMCMI